MPASKLTPPPSRPATDATSGSPALLQEAPWRPPVLAAVLLSIPVASVAASQLHDTYTDARGEKRRHDAIDIPAPLGTPVLAVDDGTIIKLFDSKPGGLTIYHFDPAGEFAYYYAHLDRYAVGLAEGHAVRRGDVIGFVGFSGNADPLAPHLHFAIFRLGPEKSWWKGTAINPYPCLGGR